MNKSVAFGIGSGLCLAFCVVNGAMAINGGIQLTEPWLIKFGLLVVLPAIGSGLMAFASLVQHGAAVEKALNEEPPMIKEAGSSFIMDAGGVQLRLTVAKDRVTTATDRDKIVEAVRGVLAVTEDSQ